MAAMASPCAPSLPSSSTSNFPAFNFSSSSFDVRSSCFRKWEVSGKFVSQNLAFQSTVSGSRVARIAGRHCYRGRGDRLARCALDRDERPVSEKEGKPVEIPPSWLEPSSSKQTFDDFESSPIQKWLYPGKEELPDDVEMTIWDHLEELRERILISVGFVGLAILGCFFYAKDLVTILEAPVYSQGVRFLQLSPGEYFFTTLKVSGYSGLLIGSPIILYEIIAFVVPGLTMGERKFLAPIVFGSSILFYSGLFFSYKVLTPAALTFFINYAEGVVESLWSIDQYFEFVFVLMLSTGLSFQVPVIQLLLGNLGLVSGRKMLSIWRYVVVGAVIAAAVLTPSTDPLTQLLLAGPLIGLYMGGAYAVLLTESATQQPEP